MILKNLLDIFNPSFYKKNKTFEIKTIQRLCKSTVGSHDWLIGTELLYGGIHTNVKRDKVSPFDPRTKDELKTGGMVGGDRMYHHGYSSYYAKYLKPFLQRKKILLIEIGILRGTGLAIWCDLFPKGRIIGLDIDLSHYKNNLPKLFKMGAFTKNQPELYEFDQYIDNEKYLATLLGGEKVDICIDDGNHSDEPIKTTFKSIFPHLSETFIYFIEDNTSVTPDLIATYPQLNVYTFGEFIVISPLKPDL
jgi:hypothetical protein